MDNNNEQVREYWISLVVFRFATMTTQNSSIVLGILYRCLEQVSLAIVMHCTNDIPA